MTASELSSKPPVTPTDPATEPPSVHGDALDPSSAGGDSGESGTDDLSAIPPNAMPWMLAAAKYAEEQLTVILIGGDWVKADAAFAEMLTEQVRWTGSAVAASSKADSELDYFGSGE